MISGAGFVPFFQMPDPATVSGPDRQDIANFEEEKGAFMSLSVLHIPYRDKIIRSRRQLRRKLKRVRKKAEATGVQFLRRHKQNDETGQEDRVFA